MIKVYITLHIYQKNPHMKKKKSVHHIQQGTVEETCTRIFGWICRPRRSSETFLGMLHCKQSN